MENVPSRRIRRKSSALKLGTLSRSSTYSTAADADLDDMNQLPSSSGPQGVGSVPNLPSASLSSALEGLRTTVQKRITTFKYLREAHGGQMYWFNTVLLDQAELVKAFSATKMRSRTLRLAVLGMSLSSLLDLTSAHDFLRGLLSLVLEFDSVTDDKFEKKNPRSLFRVASRPRRSNAGVADFPIGLPEDASYLQTPNIPFDLDYFQVLFTTCDLVVITYQKILDTLGPSSFLINSTSASNLAVPGGAFPQPPSASGTSAGSTTTDRSGAAGLSPALVDVVLKIDLRLKKIVAVLAKDLDALARSTIKAELEALSGAADWGLADAE